MDLGRLVPITLYSLFSEAFHSKISLITVRSTSSFIHENHTTHLSNFTSAYCVQRYCKNNVCSMSQLSVPWSRPLPPPGPESRPPPSPHKLRRTARNLKSCKQNIYRIKNIYIYLQNIYRTLNIYISLSVLQLWWSIKHQTHWNAFTLASIHISPCENLYRNEFIPE